MRRILYPFCLVIFLLAGCASASRSSQPPSTTPNPPTTGSTTTAATAASIPGLNLPAGFQISVYARDLNMPRFMSIGPAGVLLVANRGTNSILALLPGSSPQQAGAQRVIASNLNDPTSLVMHDGYLYVGEQTSIARMALGKDLKAGPVERIITDLPAGGQHATRTVLIGPDNHIYVSIGSSCNVCIEKDPHRAAVWEYNLDGSQGKLYARGLRNAVGMAVNPWNQQIWVSVNGRDLMGDNVPPETIYALKDQGDYGWPRCHAGNIIDPDFGRSAAACQGVQQPLVKMQAHSAPLGIDFYPKTATQFPSKYQDSLYIAFHGSWNRNAPTGYKVVRVPLHNGAVAGSAEDFITGWLTNEGPAMGRPVGITFAPDGTLFVSDDKSGVIYHVWYQA
ncbi:sorbosone dehydrogenase family protein [Ktedonosporobacter rubrisoli]|uniref:Sorbosone dehydrogenase family protein n=1 Tax=Ktedonosporobacter rubrisoli TaxID=2509675 RepID=A0A4V0Z029_KTERU|nr:PQQ-dependent sugar dehydrogenase [Ktedonosporobacter rubrisoli]QBD81781.1 sorbosone dehydrogenase family protein [Ktedonosporobacter rubrisoli]